MIELIVDAGGDEKCSPMCISGSLTDVQFQISPTLAWASIQLRDGLYSLCMTPPASAANTTANIRVTKNSCYVNGLPTSTDSIDYVIRVEDTVRTFKADLSSGQPPLGFNTQEYFGRHDKINPYEAQFYTDASVAPFYDPFSNAADGLKLTARRATDAEKL